MNIIQFKEGFSLNLWGKSIIGLLGIFILVVAISGCSSSNAFENNKVSFEIPVNWTVTEQTTNSDQFYVELKPSEENLLIDIETLQSNHNSTEWMDGIEKEGFGASPKFQVLKRENVTVDGQPGEWIVFNDVTADDDTFSGPIYTTSEVVFQKNGENLSDIHTGST